MTDEQKIADARLRTAIIEVMLARGVKVNEDSVDYVLDMALTEIRYTQRW